MILCDGRTFSVKPDVIADFTHMPYDNETFKMVIFDPPHLLRNVGTSKYAAMYGSLNCKAKPKGYQQIKYGAIDMNWRETLRAGFAECFRVLQKGGVLIFKWSDIDIPVSKILELTPYKPLFGNRCGKQNKMHWICFVKD